MTPDSADAPYAADPYAALRHRGFLIFLLGKVAADLGSQMQNTALGWELYEKTGRPLSLGYVGLAQIVPILVLAIPAGQVADLLDRKRLLIASQMVMALASVGLALVSWKGATPQWAYACLALSGVGRAFQQPARASLLPSIVPPGLFTNAVTWNVTGFQLSMVLGPAAGGFLVARFADAKWVYLLDAAMALLFATLVATVQRTRAPRNSEIVSWKSFAAGLSFVHRTKVLLGALTLDMLAVLFGGAVALLPIYAKDILLVGPTGMGWLRAAPSVGAIAMTYFLTHRPPLERAGRALLVSVAGFGLATIVFGLSRSFWLSMAMLFLTGAFDMISVVVRHTLVQTLTPDFMRGRVSAVNGLFIGVSNELGAYESGLVADVWSPVVSAVSGGVGTLLVVFGVWRLWPEVARVGRLDRERAEHPEYTARGQ